VVLWTRFGEPGEHRLTVEVVAEQEATGDDDDGGTVTVTRDVVVDVQPAEIALDVRTRALSPADLRSDDEDQNAGGSASAASRASSAVAAGSRPPKTTRPSRSSRPTPRSR